MNDDNNDGDYDDDCDKDDACYCDKQVVVVLTKMILAIIITTIIITSPIITTIIGVVLQSFILEIPVRKSFYCRTISAFIRVYHSHCAYFFDAFR